MKRRTPSTLVVAALCALLAFFVWRAVRPTAAPDGDEYLAFDRVWVEKRPDRHADYVHLMLLLQGPHIGFFQRASSYDLRMELAEFSRDKGNVKMVFPQSGAKKDFTVRVTQCSSLPPFDLCLDVSPNPWGGPQRYYGFSDTEEEQKQLGSLASEARARASLGAPSAEP